MTEFIVVDIPSPYNAIVGRDWLHRMKGVAFTLHQAIKFVTPRGEEAIYGDQVAAKQCYIATVSTKAAVKEVQMVEDDIEVLEDVRRDPEAKVIEELARAECSTGFSTGQTKGEKSAPEHVDAVIEEVEKLREAYAIVEVIYPSWLSNMVVVKKKTGKWRVCVDFTNLNRACPKDCFPLPNIGQLVNSTSGHARMSFLDAYRGYHQIALHKPDQEKMAFIAPRGVFCYKVMPFGLKNAGATYQRMVIKMFKSILGRTMDAYIDDMVVKSREESDHLRDLSEILAILRQHKLRLNAAKCAFGVGSGKFLGHLVTRRGIEANPEQITAIDKLTSPRNAKENRSKPPQVGDHNLQGASPELQQLNGNTEVNPGPPGGDGTSDSPEGAKVIIEPPQVGPSLAWEIHVDGAKNSQGAGAGVVLKSPEGAVFEQCLQFSFPTTNNEAEYEALIVGLRFTNKLGVHDLCIYSDSKLVVNQVMGKFEARRIKMAKYLRMAKSLISEFRTVKIEQVGRELNAHANLLATLTTVFEGEISRTVAVDIISAPSIEDMQESVMVNTELGPSWMDPIVNYLRTDKLPNDKREAHRIRIKAARFWISPSGDLYKRSYQGPYLLCVHPSLIEDVLYEIHEVMCGLHSGGRSLAHRALSQGYW
ncbi:uncharacterized protein LOC130768918 [Actinidia eriantha]|uniref:uncharacterized protein LOC130768918 n=1 Tax=Actinidia eriantha TaxID=165200 RepID=UPI002582A503|nr:uncharacterized protein LOC130768918 [Actinidia eriantha]